MRHAAPRPSRALDTFALIDRIKDEGDKASACHFDSGTLIPRGVLACRAVSAGNKNGGPAPQIARLARPVHVPGHKKTRPAFENDAVYAIVSGVHRSDRPRVKGRPHGVTAERRLGGGAHLPPSPIHARRSSHVKPGTISFGILNGETMESRAISAIFCIKENRLAADVDDKRLRNLCMHNDSGNRKQYAYSVRL